MKARLYSVLALLSIAVGALVAQGLVPDGGARHTTKYVTAGACALAALLLYGLADQGLQRIPHRGWRMLSGIVVPPLILLAGLFVAVMFLKDTPYHQTVLQH